MISVMSQVMKYHYNLRRLNLIFACVCVLLLASMVWLIKVDYCRRWRDHQEDYVELQGALAYFDILADGSGGSSGGESGGLVKDPPLFDFLSPRGTLGKKEVRQVVLPGIRVDLNFVERPATDRCMTCHVGIDDKGLTKKKLAERLAGAVSAIHGGDVDGGGVFFDAVVEQINAYQASRRKPALTLSQPLLGHPDPDLYAATDSAHPMKQMGCTVCHEGNGEETDFVLASHTPSSETVGDEWKEKYYVRRAGVIAEHTFASAAEGWDHPMLPLQFTEAGCVKCHSKVADVAVHDWQPTAERINEGRYLFTSMGCVNCHLVDEFAASKRVGPDLSHVGDKLNRGFLHNWIWFPKNYRPSTPMPHFFRQENNDSGSAEERGDRDPELRTRTEVIAISEYLLALSDPYVRVSAPEDLWASLKDAGSAQVPAAADRGRRLLGSVGCLGCHTVLAYRPDDKEYGGLLDPIGSTWIISDIAADLFSSTKREGQSEDDFGEAIWDQASQRYEKMNYIDRVAYAMGNFADLTDTIFAPKRVEGPIFNDYGPELSSIGTKFSGYEQAVEWLYDWLKNPRHYSGYTRMPKLRLEWGQFPEIDMQTHQPTGLMVDADEALDLAIYLSGLDENKRFSLEPFDVNQVDRRIFERERDELIRTLLSGVESGARAEAVLSDKDGVLTEDLVSALSKSQKADETEAKIRGLGLEERRWFWLGQRLIGHYGCYSCHKIGGFERVAGPGPELTSWGAKPVSQLDFGYFGPGYRDYVKEDQRFGRLYPVDREKLIGWSHDNPHTNIQATRASFAWHKLRNPRMWYRGQVKDPYDKLKMPNFFFTDDQADALVTFVLSRRPSGVNKVLQVDYSDTPAGMIGDGRNLARRLNCFGCHKIDGNKALIDQYYQVEEGVETVFDEFNAPPWLHGHGARAQGEWLYDYLYDVDTVRPWLKVRMPSYHLNKAKSAKSLVEYLVGLCQDDAKRVKDKTATVRKYEADERKVRDDVYASALAGLKRFGSLSRWESHGSFSVQEILDRAEKFSDLYDIENYPYPEKPIGSYDPDEVADGETLFYELRCLTCHVFGDPTIRGANPYPSAPNLQRVSDRLSRAWVKAWLERPSRFMPATTMPMHFGEDLSGAFKDYLPEHRETLGARLKNKALLDDGIKQIEAIMSFLFEASEKRLNKVQPIWEEEPLPLAETSRIRLRRNQ
jgi:cbb3-type cytochrome oxidase cytochrome c subunit